MVALTSRARPLFLVLLATACFSLAACLELRVSQWGGGRAESDSAMSILFGDGRKIFAERLFTEADISFHSGYYPTIFDQTQAPKGSRHMTSEEGSPEEEEHERKMSFLGEPKDWIERFGRHFFVTEHTHLEGGTEREILPWLKLSAEMDPYRIDTYRVAAYWLRTRLNKVAEAEQFLRDGLRMNPKSYELLFELGQLYYASRHDSARARLLWVAALKCWDEQEPQKKEPDNLGMEQIVANLARIDKEEGRWQQAIEYLERAKKTSPAAEAIQQQIDELKLKAGAGKPG
jgi:tetratricopeptide (TPR) repeat protein